jgi:hypothetical protein
MRNRIVLAVLMFVFCMFMPRTAAAWNCKVPGQIRVQVPTGTVGHGNGDGDGEVVVDSGLTFICEALPTPNGNPQTQTQNQTATGGLSNSNSTSVANSNSASGVTNSGNSSNQNSNTANAVGGQGGKSSAKATGGNQSQSATAASTGGNNSNNTNIAAPNLPVTSAYAPSSLPSAPCIKGFGVGVQSPSAGISIGGGKVDTGCDERELARSYALLGSKIAACKILVANERSQKAGVTLEDCMGPVALAPAAQVDLFGAIGTPTPSTPTTEESLGDYARRITKGQQ